MVLIFRMCWFGFVYFKVLFLRRFFFLPQPVMLPLSLALCLCAVQPLFYRTLGFLVVSVSFGRILIGLMLLFPTWLLGATLFIYRPSVGNPWVQRFFKCTYETSSWPECLMK